MKALIIPLLVIAAAAAPAAETSLTLTSNQTTITIDPSLGTISLYFVQDGRLNKRPDSANFLTDLRFLLKRPVQIEGGTYNSLRIGSLNNVPMPAQVIQKLAEAEGRRKKPAKGEEPPLSLVERAQNTEQEFWEKIEAKPEPYDGVISAAFGGRFLMIVVPAVRSFLMYEIQGEQILDAPSWHPYGPELYVPQVWNSSPTPQEIFDQLPDDVKDEQAEALKQQAEAMGEGASKTIPVQDSEVWCVAGPQERFVLLDIANKHLMSYQYGGKNLELRSVRNLEIDLLIPSAFNSTPDQRQLFQEFTRDKARKDFLEQLGIVQLDVPEIKAIVAQRQVKAAKSVSPVQATAMPGMPTFDVVIDFTQQQKLLAYRAVGAGNGLQFMAMRDYTIDSALSQLDNLRVERAQGAQMLAQAKQILNNRNVDLAWITAKTALLLDPALYAQVEKTPDMAKAFAKQADYQQVIQAATEAHKRELQAIEERKKKAQELREKKNGKK